MAAYSYILSCEHGGNKIPSAYHQYFTSHTEVLASHRGWDPGALEVAAYLSEAMNRPLVHSTTSRLLIEMNRSLDHPELFSEFSIDLSEKEKSELLSLYYFPYRTKIISLIEHNILQEKINIHLSMHSFVPELNGVKRQVDIGILFDPSRPLETAICKKIKEELQLHLEDFVIEYNQPYLGIDDGLTTSLRINYPNDIYAGIEVEVNQKWVGTKELLKIKNALHMAILSL